MSNKVYHLTKQALPLSCPTKNMSVWNMHPRIYLAIEKTGHTMCPYCGTKFILEKQKS